MTGASDPAAADAPWAVARLVCPATRTPLRHDAGTGTLASDAAGIAYPIRDGVPILIVEAGMPVGG